MEVLLSVMEQGDPVLYIEKLNIRSDAVIVNQCDREDDRIENVGGHRIRIAERRERGLSRSRNLALTLASDDICIFCDNDVRYLDGAFDTIEQGFLRYPTAGIICFFIERPERGVPVRKDENIMSDVDRFRIFSPEIAVSRSNIGDLRLDEDFGAGAKYRMGEENIFLFEAKRRGIESIYVPEKIAKTLPNKSSWFTGYDERFFFDRGAGYEAMDSGRWYPYALQFLIRKRKLYKENISMRVAYKAMRDGRKEYKNSRDR